MSSEKLTKEQCPEYDNLNFYRLENNPEGTHWWNCVYKQKNTNAKLEPFECQTIDGFQNLLVKEGGNNNPNHWIQAPPQNLWGEWNCYYIANDYDARYIGQARAL